jgi:S-DNA-T family DNA segregation ATPase FtsK/SpoIIIE
LYDGSVAAAEPTHERHVLAQEELHRLTARSPAAYGSWGPTDLKRVLEPYGAEQK